MPTFLYKARDSGGRLIEGSLEVDTENDAAGRIEEMGLSPVFIAAQSAAANIGLLFRKQFRRISRQEMLIFTRQLSTLISTGVPLIQALLNVSEQSNNAHFREVINDIVNSLKSGASFSVSLRRYPDIFPGLYISMVRVGEAGGMLDKVLVRLAELSTQDIDLRSRLRSALIYPLVLAIIAFVIVNFVLVGVLPKFVTIFEASQANLPIPTRLLLGASNLLRNFWWLLAIVVILGTNAFRKYYGRSEGRFKIDGLLLRLPLFGPLILKILVCRLSRSIAALTKSGIPILEALSVVESTVNNTAVQRVLQNVRLAISRGQSLTEPFAASHLFPAMVIQLINTGERSGKLDQMFDQIADFYEPEIEYTVRNLTSLLEPAMLVGMGLVVAFIALSVLLPIFNLIKVIRR